jgi:hypothetical protein
MTWCFLSVAQAARMALERGVFTAHSWINTEGFPCGAVRRGSRTSGRYWTAILVVIWMTMAPLPIVVLLLATAEPELMILPVPFAEINAIGTVFPLIPLMIVVMIPIVVAVMVDASGDDHFLCCGCFWRG